MFGFGWWIFRLGFGYSILLGSASIFIGFLLIAYGCWFINKGNLTNGVR
jgi:hypothetical protein